MKERVYHCKGCVHCSQAIRFVLYGEDVFAGYAGSKTAAAAAAAVGQYRHRSAGRNHLPSVQRARYLYLSSHEIVPDLEKPVYV